ncbi:hypothetical protein BX264_5996 [Streptomyces sp. 2333.5]|uniref:hypothetical protein n=1 Tax=unclassified Streptomyces TaxID=2593676 RepID=UPI00089C8706|nr:MULTISPECIES: hypothetical protein [unclassified Streptomyces]PJJ05535.1 hypothetical protein BX264_5996 [Streptomyces sp. 2333.5]SEE78387.1 hypothetical protein SAMN05428943_6094 [Streptomyces sp. 2314.4]SEF00530.1 hypothetical protein SAMN05428942_6094 [Streptomyces sp. 2112.2]SOE10075.1 hypothetical protein SAMN06272775_1123 [Streptomyces sp. 2323.1]
MFSSASDVAQGLLSLAGAAGLSPGSGVVPAGLPGLVGALELCTGLVVLCAGAFTLGELTDADGPMPAVEPLPGPPCAARCAPPVDVRGNA